MKPARTRYMHILGVFNRVEPIVCIPNNTNSSKFKLLLGVLGIISSSSLSRVEAVQSNPV